MVKDISHKLDIFLITYNRAKHLDYTLSKLFAEDSSIKDYSITVIDNASTDETPDVVKKYQLEHPQLFYTRNKYNIGGNANIARAYERAEKEYVWVLCDDDEYIWTAWDEVVEAIENGEDAIVVANTDNPKLNIAQLFAQTSFVAGVIYKTSNIDSTVVMNMQFNIANMFSHLAISAKLINENKAFKIISKPIVIYKAYDDMPVEKTYIRGYKKEDIHPYMENMSYSAGYANSIQFIRDKKLRNFIVNKRLFYYPVLTSANVFFENHEKFKDSFYNLMCIFNVLNLWQKIRFLFNWLMFYSLYRIIYIYRQDKFDKDTLEVTTYIRVRLFYFIKMRILKFKNEKIKVRG